MVNRSQTPSVIKKHIAVQRVADGRVIFIIPRQYYSHRASYLSRTSDIINRISLPIGASHPHPLAMCSAQVTENG